MATSELDARRLVAMGDKLHSRNNISTRGIRLTDAEIEAIMDGFEKEDDSEKTWTRRLVENYLQNYRWYFPRKDIPGCPSLSKAWAYYEHVTLPRHFIGGNSAGTVLRRAEPGEQGDTELYKPLSTRQSHLIEFGIGTDLYFQTCAMLAIMFLIAGMINISNIYFFATEYSGDKSRGWALEGSAVCVQTYWAICNDCPEEDFRGEAADRFGTTSDGTVLVERNDCEIGLEQGIINWATWVFFFLFLTAMSLYLRAREIRFDEDTVTASDYSVVVKNPPPDAFDPDEWRDYFTQFAEKQVTIVTIHLNNEEMLRKLYRRRIYRDSLRRLLPKAVDLDNEDVVRTAIDVHIRERDAEPKGCIGRLLECTVFWILRKCFGMFLQAETLVELVYDLTFEIQQLQTNRYGVSKVYVTFETEEGQRAALTALSASRIDVMMNNTQSAPPSAVFRGRVLKVVQPTEPNAVRWLDLSDSKTYRTVSSVATFVITVGLIALAAFLEDRTRAGSGPRMSGPLVTVFNSVIPMAVKILMLFERHQTEGDFQSSLYLKITMFRWMNTAIVLQIITPFTSSLGASGQDLLPSISAILWSELWISPALRLLDMTGNFKKHILAPRAMTQEQMNLNFLGTSYNLGERYTDLTKVLFVCFFYSALFPASFIFGFAILAVQYFTDKFCLLRIWGRAPSLGSNLAVFSRRYFFTGAVVAFVIASSYAFAQFPYDNVCDLKNGTVTPANISTSIVTLSGEEKAVTIGQVEPVFHCPQGFRRQNSFNFPPKVSDQPDGLRWMTEDQETIVTAFRWTVIVAVVVFFVAAFLSTILHFVVSIFRSNYETRGASQRIDFSCNPEISAYIPSVYLNSYPYPFLAANVDDLCETLMGFTDPDHNIDEHNMLFDVPYPGMHRPKRVGSGLGHSPACHEGEADTNPTSVPSPEGLVFGVVKHYPPDWWDKEHDEPS